MLHKIFTPMALAALAFVAVIAVAAFYVSPAKAGGWAGCYGGVGGNYAADVAGGVLGADGPGVSILAGCDMQAQKLVFGGWAEYGWDWRQFAGVDLDVKGWAAGARAGYIVVPGALAYGLVGWTQQDLSLSGVGSMDADGWLVGGGAEFDLGSGFFGRAEYRYTRLDLDIADDNVQSGRLALIYKFDFLGNNAPAFGTPLK